MPVNMKSIIAKTFIDMAKQKGIDKITVKALIDECNISRQTFYYHFQDLMEVIEWSMEQALGKMLQESLKAPRAKDALNVLISSTLENQTLIRKLMDSQRRKEIERLFVSMTRTYLEELVRGRNQNRTLNYSDMEVALTSGPSDCAGFSFSAASPIKSRRRIWRSRSAASYRIAGKKTKNDAPHGVAGASARRTAMTYCPDRKAAFAYRRDRMSSMASIRWSRPVRIR